MSEVETDTTKAVLAVKDLQHQISERDKRIEALDAEVKAARREGFIEGWESCESNAEFDGLSMEANLDLYLSSLKSQAEGDI